MIIIPLEYTLNKKYNILNLENFGGVIFLWEN
ncbi:hypothetical protein J2Z71_001676, partial [Peptoniphilus stercorisuis]|nr:hypothetical protein [Peptoniphilus stercorisuis]MBP2026118.1 hypothetical protein [Peptoniphilus stercorisuis]